MGNARLSILGLTEYDPSIWDDVSFPGTIDKQTIIDKIVIDNAELGLVYTKPETVKLMLRVWSRTSQDAWQRIWRALTEDYNPIHNYDRYEDWKDTGSEDRKDTGSEEWTDEGTATTGVMGYNASTFTDANKVDSENSREVTTENTREVKTGNTRVGRAYGNIGVTTSAQMIEGEIGIRTTMIYAQIISDLFKQQFCVMVY